MSLNLKRNSGCFYHDISWKEEHLKNMLEWVFKSRYHNHEPNLANLFVIKLSCLVFSDSRSCLVLFALYFLSSCLLFESDIWGDSC